MRRAANDAGLCGDVTYGEKVMYESPHARERPVPLAWRRRALTIWITGTHRFATAGMTT
jgi:hypothetical protein